MYHRERPRLNLGLESGTGKLLIEKYLGGELGLDLLYFRLYTR
jgi:hypothetical protein